MAATSFMQSVVVTAVVLVLCACCSNYVSSIPDTTFYFKACNVVSYSSGDPFAQSVDYVLTDMVNGTVYATSYTYYTRSPYAGSVAYGHGLCDTLITDTDCRNCMRYVKERVVANCPNSIGVQIVLRDCRMRYENYPFTD